MRLCLVLAFDFLPATGQSSCLIDRVYLQAITLRSSKSRGLRLFHRTLPTISLGPCKPFPSFLSGLPPFPKSLFVYLEPLRSCA